MSYDDKNNSLGLFFFSLWICVQASISGSVELLLYWRIRINYALYEELEAEDLERTREVYR